MGIFKLLFQRLRRRKSDSSAQPARASLQSFILEPILTPSGLVDGLDDTPEPSLLELDPLDFDEGIIEGDSDTPIPPIDPLASTSNLPETLDPLPFIDNPTPALSALSQTSSTGDPGIFTVGDSGSITIDYLFDGGAYRGQLAAFSLEGIEHLEAGSEAFIAAATNRALSNSELGHILISDFSEGARFSGELGERNWNQGDYLGVKTFEMRAGDEFALMLLPKGSAKQVWRNPGIGGSKQPLFSIASANPEGAFHLAQIADISGEGGAFTWEDLRVDGPSDGDYNDLIFQLSGVEGETIALDSIINPELDWRESDLGQELIDFIGGNAPEDTQPPEIDAVLVNDTGNDSSDQLTFDPRISGSVRDSSEVSSLLASLNSPTLDVEIDTFLSAAGSFTLDSRDLAEIAGSDTLVDGEHTLFLQASDQHGNDSEVFEFSFTLDTTPPAIAVDLAPEFDTAPLGDYQTELGLVTLMGHSEPHSQVMLLETGTSITADETGHFEFTNVSLELGNNEFNFEATDRAGNQSSHSQTIARIDPLPDILLEEESHFSVSADHRFQVPDSPTVLSFEIAEVGFDSNDPNRINDAFEAALLDREGNPLVHTIGPGNDAFFNLTEGEAANLAPGVSFDGQRVSVNLSQLPGGSEATLELRLVNNDSDTETSARIRRIHLQPNPDPSAPVTRAALTAAPVSEPVNFSQLSDVSASIVADYGQTSFNADSQVLYAELSLSNSGSYSVDGPVLVAIDGISDPSVQVINPDGFTPEGLPYYDFSRLAPTDQLDPGEQGNPGTIAFFNPTGEQFDYELVVLAETNAAPVIESSPEVEIIAGLPYQYDADAVDPNGDVLSYELLVAPSGMTIDPESGLIAWATAPDDIANHAVVLQVSDGRGGVALQTFTLAVIEEPPNRPPIFTSTPEVDAWINQLYQYDADAIDPDQDALAYSLILGPDGISIHPDSGEVQWTPPPVLSLGDTVLGQASLPGDNGEFSFSGVVGQRIYFDPLQFSGSAGDWDFDVYSPSGEKILDGDLRNNHILSLSESGSYRIVVDAQGDHTGTYGFSVIDLGLVPIAPLDTVIEGSLGPGSEDDIYRFTGNAGQKLFFDKISNSNNLGWVLYDANNQVVAIDHSFRDMEIHLPADGEYMLALQGNSGFTTTVDYAFEIITPDEITAPLNLGNNANPNGIFAEIAEKGEEDFYTFTGHSGQRIYFDRLFQDGTATWAHIASIISPSGRTIFNHNLQSGSDPTPILLNESGTYRIEIDGSGEQTGNYSFSLLDLDRATPINTDRVYSGTLDPGQESHFYQFPGSAGQRLYLDSPGNISGAAGWTLYDSRNQLIAGASSISGDLEVVLSESETYTLIFDGRNGESPINYSFEIVTPKEEIAPLTINESVAGEIIEKGERDTYTFSGTQGQRLFLDTLQASTALNATLVSPSGRLLFNQIGFTQESDRHPVILPEDGTYQLIVDGGQENLDTYHFQLLDLDTAPTLVPETLTSGSLDPGRLLQVYQLNGNEGDRIYVENQANSSLSNHWRLYGPGNQQLTTPISLNRDFETVLPASGTYYLLLQGAEDTPVPYEIQWVPTTAPASLLALNSPVEGEIGKLGEQDRYRFNGTVGQTLYFVPRAGDSDLTVEVYNPSGNRVLSGDMGSDSAPLVLTEAGEYELIVDGTKDTTGNYSFLLADTAPPLLPATRLNGTLDAGEIIFYRLDGSQGQQLDFESLNAAPGADWIVYAPTTLPGDTKVVNSAALRDSFTSLLPADGPYILALRNPSDAAVRYDIQVSDISAAVVTTAGLDTLYRSTIATGGEVDVYAIDANAGRLILFDGQGNDSSQRVRLFNPDGTLVFSNLDNRNDAGPYQLTQTGSYQLEVYGQFSSSTGNYQFQLVDLQTAPELTLDRQVDVALAGKETKVLQFNGSAGQQLWLDGLNTSDPNVTATVFNESGHLLATLNDLRHNIELLTLDADGDYYLVLQSDNVAATTASFRLLDAATASSLSLDSDISGDFGTSRRETQLYRFSGSKDQRLYFNASGDRDNVYQVYGPDGQRLFSFPLLGDFEVAALPADGEYTLALIGTEKANNSYSVQIVTPDPREILLVIGDTITGEIAEAGEQTTYTFEGNENQRLFFDSLAEEALDISLYSPSGVQLWHSQGTHVDRAPTTLNETGTYRLVVDGKQDLTSSYRFRLLDLDEATPISLDSEIADDFGTSLREAHLYRFNGSAGQPLFFDRTVGAGARRGVSNYYALYGPDGEPFVVPRDLKFDDEAILPSDGEYTLVVGGAGELDPNYALELVTPEWLPASPYTIGDTLSSSISEAGERDRFTFTARPGQQLLFDSLLRADQIEAKLVAPSGNIVWQQQPLSSDRPPFILVEAGPYTLEIDGSGDTVGDYRFRLLDLAADATPISLDASLNGDFGPSAREAQIYRFSAPAGQHLYFDRSSGSAFNHYALYDEHGQPLFSERFDRDYEGSETLLPETGDYTLILSGNGNPNRNYSLEVVTPEVMTIPHQLGETLSGEIGETGEQDIYTFEGTSGQQLWFDSLDNNSPNSLRLELLAPNGEAFFEQELRLDDGLVTLPADGTYRIVVDGSGDAKGNYRFRFLNAATAEVLPLDTLVSGDFGNSQQQTQLYTFTGSEGQSLYFDSVTDHLSDRYLLYDPDGKLLVPQSQNGDFELKLQQTGRYALVVQGSREDSYQFEVVTPLLHETSLSLGETVASRIDEAGEQDAYMFTGTVGQQLYFDALTGDTSLRALLYSPSGKLIEDWSTSHNGSPVTLTEAGDYRLVLDGLNTATGEYRFRLWDLAAVPSLPLDATAEDTLDPGNATAFYQLAGERGQVLHFDLEAEQWQGANWVLYGPGDTVIAAPGRDAPDFEVTLPANGVYALAIVGTATTPLDYRFQVNDQTPAPVIHGGLNTPISGTLTAGETIEHPFSATAGTQILLDSLNNSNAQIRFNLINPDGSPAFSNFDSRFDSAPLLLEQSGDYTLQIYGRHSSTSGNYALQLLEFPADSTSALFNPLEPGSVTAGSLSPGLEAELYSFAGQTGQQLLFNGMAGSNVTATLYAPTGETVFSTSNYRSSDLGPLTLNQDGLYHLVVKGEQTTDRDYAFQLLNFDVGQPIPLNLPIAGHLLSGQQSELYSFTGTAGDTLFFDSLQGSFRHAWKLYGPDGEQLHSTLLGVDFELELPADGDYTLLIEGNSSTTPLDYEFRILTHADEPNFVVTPGTGETASNDDNALGLFPVQIEVSDGQGGTDIQDYTIRLLPDPDNTSPVITSTAPNTRYGLNQTAFRYQLDSLDADGDLLTYRLVDAPLGALIDANSGELLWFPETAVPGESYDFTVEVVDGRGGFDRQRFSVDVHEALGTIQGAVFEDLNNNGYRDTALVQGDDPAIVFAIDVSGSTGGNLVDWTTADLETVADDPMGILGMEIATAVALSEQLIRQGRGHTAQIAVMPFEIGARILDLDPAAPGVQLFTTPLADTDNNGIPDLRQALNTLNAGGGTFFTPPLETAAGIFSSLSNDPNLIFLSDGFGSVDLEAVEGLNEQGVNITAFGIGAGASLEQLQKIDPDAIRVTDPQEVVDIFNGWDERYTVEPLMENVTVYLDLNENGQLDADEPRQRTQPDTGDPLLGTSVYHFRFNNLPAGTYTLRQVVPPGFEETVPETGSYIETITVGGGEVIVRLFGNHGIEDAPNQAPVFTATPPSEVLVPGDVFAYQALAADPDPDRLRYDLPLAPAGMSIDPDTGDLVWVPQADQTGGSYPVIVRVQDGEGGQDLQAFELEVVPANRSPVFTSIVPTALSSTANNLFAYQLTAIDPDGDPVIYSLQPDAPGGFNLDPDTGVLTWTPQPGQVGSQSVTVRAADGRGGEALITLPLQVVETTTPNTAPIVTSQPRTEAQIGLGYLYRVVAEDADNDPLSVRLVTAPAGMTLQNNSLITWTPTPAQLGIHAVEIEVSDGRGGTTTLNYLIDASNQAVNRPPSITSVPQTLTHLERLYQYQLAGIDPDGDVLFWSLLEAPAGMVIDGETGTLSWQPTADQVGDHTVAIQLRDALGQTAVQEFTLQVNGINTPPAIVSTPMTRGTIDEPYTYSVTATDPENDPLRFSLGLHPEGLTIDAETGSIAWTPTEAGSETVEVLVEDDQGGSNRQVFTLEVGAEVLNLAPSITSTPLFLADTNQPYVYPVTAIDPDGDELTFELIVAPTEVAIDPQTGEVTWAEPVLGNHQVVVGVTDGALGAAQGFTLTVQENLPPVFDTSVTPPASVAPDRLYRYDVQAFDPNGGPLTYRLDAASQDLGITLDQLGRLRWTPTQADTGSHSITIEVVDAQGTTASQTFEIAVTADTQAPLVNLQVSNVFVTSEGFEADLGTEVSFQVLATDDVGVENLQLFVDDAPVQLDASGIATVTLASVGTLSARAVATDAAGNQGDAAVLVLALDPSDNEGPQVSLDISRIEDGVITAPTDIFGTVSDDNLEFYTLEVAPLDGSAPFVEIARGTDEVAANVLGEFDPTTLLNDSYVLRLTARDAGGNVSIAEDVVHVEGALKLGNFQLSFVDLQIPVSGIPITVARTYDSLAANRQDDLGYGWRLEFRDTDLRTSLGRDEQYEQLGIPSKAFREGTKVFVTLPGGERTSFTFQPEIDPAIQKLLNAGAFIPPSLIFYTPKFVAEDGSELTLSVKDEKLIRNRQGDSSEFYSVSGYAYNPAVSFFGGTYTLTTQDGIEYEIDGESGDLLAVTDLNGNQLTFTDGGIFSDTGRNVTFERDAQNRIVAVIDPEGNRIEYDYDDQSDLVAVTDRESSTTQFVYDEPDRPHFLTEVIDPLGRTGARTEYDKNGRLKRILDASGEAIEMVYDPENSTQTVLDVFGNPTIYEYDQRGNVVQEIDALGKIVKRTYDDQNNMLTETIVSEESGPEGWTTTYTYDAQGNQLTVADPLSNITRSATYGDNGRLLSETDAFGNTTSYEYSHSGLLLAVKDPTGNIIRYEYDLQGQMTGITDSQGNKTDSIYDRYGNVTNISDGIGNRGEYVYDSNGELLAEMLTFVTEDGLQDETTIWSRDAEGRITAMTDSSGHTISYEYDAQGNIAALTEGADNRVEYRYNANNELIETIYADDTPDDFSDNPRIRSEYNAAGWQVVNYDHSGQATYYVYDAVGRLTETIYADNTPDDLSDNPRQRTEYYNSGRIKAKIDLFGNRVDYEYDVLGRPTLVKDSRGFSTAYTYDALGNTLTETDEQGQTIRYVYNSLGILTETYAPDGTHTVIDAAGNPLAITDSLNRTIKYEYDDSGRLIQVVLPDGEAIARTYDEGGRLIAITDQDRETVQFEYDTQGHLSKVIDPKGGETIYRYNENGNLISVEDAKNQIIRYEYDEHGQRTSVALPNGQNTQVTYDDFGNIATLTDFNGSTLKYTYDQNQRLISKQLSDGTSVDYTYTDSGLLKTLTDEQGTTTFDYDERGRLIARTDPNGLSIVESQKSIQYRYDDAGRIQAIETSVGTTSYTYDDADRLLSVTSPQNEVTTYDYDEAGNLVQANFPNGVVETRQYDVLNRLIELKTARFNASLGQSEVISQFNYILDDEGNRLSVVQQDGKEIHYKYDELDRLIEESYGDRIISYTYDSVGNRLLKSDSIGGETIYTYNTLNQLLTETTNGALTTYTYDQNGSLISKVVEGGETATYQWLNDGENRLAGITISDESGTKTIEYKYDYQGIRVAQVIDGVETRYLVDTLQAYPQVLAEYDSTGNVQASYVYGNDLISQQSGIENFFYATDGLGSTTALLDSLGQVNERYAYDAFGNGLEEANDSTNAYRFAGEQRDEATGLDYLRARYYDPETGRFISADAYEGTLTDPTSLHDYLYAHANPVMNIDPSGYVTLGEQLAAIAIRGILASQSFVAGYGIGTAILTGDPNQALEVYDQYLAGFSDILTFGGSTYLRGKLHGDVATKNHRGFLFLMGRLSGITGSMVLGYAAPVLLNGVGWSARFAQAHTVLGSGLGAFNSTRRIQLGVANPLDLVSFLPLVVWFHTNYSIGINGLGSNLGNIKITPRSTQLRTVHRGTDIAKELQVLDETGVVLSEAGRIPYLESRYAGKSINDSLRIAREASETAHATQLQAWGSLDDYVQAHGAFGQDLTAIAPRSLISFSTSQDRALYFANSRGHLGRVVTAEVPANILIPQTLPGSTEFEVLVPHFVYIGRGGVPIIPGL